MSGDVGIFLPGPLADTMSATERAMDKVRLGTGREGSLGCGLEAGPGRKMPASPRIRSHQLDSRGQPDQSQASDKKIILQVKPPFLKSSAW